MPIIIFGLQVGTLTFTDIIIQVSTFIIADIFFIQVSTLKFDDISLQVGTFSNAYNPSTDKDKTKVLTADLKIGRH